MGTAFLYGNGAGIDNLKFRVYSATSLPSSGKENDVCIITSTPISFWEAGAVDNPSWSMDAGFVYLTCDASDASQPNLLRKNALYLELMHCWQYENGTWSSKDAYQYRNGAWVQFSAVFTATINITYPAGSICTATDGRTTLTSPDTSGTWSCVVPNDGMWTITSILMTETVNVSYGQSIDINVSRIYLIKDGNTCDSITGGWSTNYYNDMIQITASKGSGYINLNYSSNNWSQGLYSTNNNIDLSKIKTVGIECYQNATPDTSTQAHVGTYLSVYSSPRGIYYNARVSLAPSIGKKTVISLPVDNISSSLRVRIGGQTGKAMTITVYNVWVEA